MLQPFFTELVPPTRPAPGGTRKVSAMTPEKLAHKRACDREAQRKNRARTKEYIGRLEKELEQLKSQKWRDRTIQDLLRRNKAIEKELIELKEAMELFEKVLPSDHSIPHHPQITEPVGYSTLPLDGNKLLAGDEASCYPHGSQFLMNNDDITDYTRLQCPSSNNEESSGSSSTCPDFRIMSTLSSAGCTTSYSPASFYTTVATANYGYSQSIGGTYSHDTVGNKGNIATNGELNPEHLLS